MPSPRTCGRPSDNENRAVRPAEPADRPTDTCLLRCPMPVPLLVTRSAVVTTNKPVIAAL
jgi:hypothetical protein